MKLQELLEAAKEKEIKVEPIDMIAILLFGKKSGPVKDLKRSKDAIFLGVSSEKSNLKDLDGKPLVLTFDNSTDSGEFEIDPLTSLKIEKGTEIDKSLRSLYHKYSITSKKKIGYISKDDKIYVRELHLGKELTKSTAKMVREALQILKTVGISQEESTGE
jgi:hypothetical protein